MGVFPIKSILNNKTSLFFISPHLDDAILSAGGLIYELKDKGRIKIITVFTKGNELFLKRKTEDKDVCRYLGIGYLHLDFVDVLWRDNPSFKKTNFMEDGQILEKTITKRLKKIINNNKDTLIFAPLALGDHTDHKIINKICRDNFTDVIYWEDYPYNLKHHLSAKFAKKNNLGCFEYKKNIFLKEKLIKFYRSQIPSLFSDKPIIIKKEKYYFSRTKIY